MSARRDWCGRPRRATSNNPSRVARTLFAIRWKLGELLGWDDPDSGVGSRVPTLRHRLPKDLHEAPAGPEFDRLPFSSVCLTDNEWQRRWPTGPCTR